MSAEKEFGKLTVEQFREVIRDLADVKGHIKELPQLIRSAPRQRLKEIFDEDFAWADVYELPYVEGIALTVCALGQAKQIIEIAAAADPQQAAIDWGRQDQIEDWNGGEGGVFKEKHVIGLVVAMQRNILSVMLYHRTLSDLVAQVKSRDDDWFEPYFKAVRVDRSILSSPTFSDRLARAELENNQDFFRHLRSALKGPSKKHWEAYQDLRYAFALLRELGFDQLSDAELEDLLVNKLKLYSNTPGARKNLRKQFTESKHVQPPKNEFSGGRQRWQ